MEKKPNVQQINIELDESVSGGEYSNFVVVTHSPAEFVSIAQRRHGQTRCRGG